MIGKKKKIFFENNGNQNMAYFDFGLPLGWVLIWFALLATYFVGFVYVALGFSLGSGSLLGWIRLLFGFGVILASALVCVKVHC